MEFPYDPAKLEEKAAQGDEEVLLRKKLGRAWLGEVNSGLYRTWEDLKFLKEHWDGPIVLKGIQSVEDAETAVDWVDGIVVSNHGKTIYSSLHGGKTDAWNCRWPPSRRRYSIT